MASNYPTSLDTFSNPSGTDSLNSPSHSLQHADINDAVEALETKIGIGDSPAGSATAGQVLTAQGGGTAIWATPALVHINTTSFSAVASQSVNDVFSASYDNYRILIDFSNISTDATVYFKLRAAGADNSTSYSWMMEGARANNTTYRNIGSNVTTGWGVAVGRGGNDRVASNFDVFKPFLATNSKFGGTCGIDDSTSLAWVVNGGMHLVTTSFDGFSLIASAGNITGTVRVYGVKN